MAVVRLSGLPALGAALLVALAGAFGGCGEPDPAVGCVPGRALACDCAAGGAGSRVCGPDGVLGACACSPGDASGGDAVAGAPDVADGADVADVADVADGAVAPDGAVADAAIGAADGADGVAALDAPGSDVPCAPACAGVCSGDDGCGGTCSAADCAAGQICGAAGLCAAPTCIDVIERGVTVIPPAGVRVSFRVTECATGLPVVAVTDPSVSVSVINDATGLPFGAGGEGGAASDADVPSSFGTFAILALDMSTSVFDKGAQGAIFDAAEAFVAAAVEGLPKAMAPQVALMVFGPTAQTQIVQPFTAGAAELYDAIDTLRATQQPLGSTNLYGAFVQAVDAVSAQGATLELAERSVVIFTDGVHEAGDTANQKALALQALSAAQANASLSSFSVCLGLETPEHQNEIKALASNPDYFACIDDAAQLTTVFAGIATKLEAVARSNAAVGVCTPVELGQGGITITVGIGEAEGTLNATYPTDQLTGDVAACTAAYIANTCHQIACGPGGLPQTNCGGCEPANKVLCEEGQCVDHCVDLACGPSPTANLSCGNCQGATEACVDNQCVDDCAGLACGASATAGLDCGTCPGATDACVNKQCVDDCAGLACGASPVAGANCGTCPGATDACVDGQCVDDCAGRSCGDSPVLGVSCGTCFGSQRCLPFDGLCVPTCGAAAIQLPVPTGPQLIVRQGDLAFMGGDAGITIVDLSVPTSPVLLGQAFVSGGVGVAAVAGTLVFTTRGKTFRVFDVADPATPTVVGSYTWTDPGLNTQSVLLNGDWAYVLTVSAGIRVMDIGTPTLPSEAGVVPAEFSSPGQIALVGADLVVAAVGPLIAFDVSDPADPTPVSTFDLGFAATVFSIAGNVAFVSGQYSGYRRVTAVSFADPAVPAVLGALTFDKFSQGFPRDIVVSGSKGLLVDGDQLTLVDVGTPAAMTIDLIVTPTTSFRGGAFVGDLLLATQSGSPSPGSLNVYEPVCP